MNSPDFYKDYDGKTIYLKYDFEDAVVRITPDKESYVKFKGEKEFLAQPSSGIVTEAYLGRDIISEDDYNKF